MEQMQVSDRYQFSTILIIESSFKREISIDFNKEIEPQIQLEVGNSKDKNPETGNDIFIVELVASVNGMQEENLIYSCSVRGVGVFEKFGNPVGAEEYFINTNAPAIIYPFVREKIASMTLSGGINTILLPPFNFVERYEEIKKNQDNTSKQE